MQYSKMYLYRKSFCERYNEREEYENYLKESKKNFVEKF